MAESKFRLPDSSHRITLIGRTGSGKTQAGAWLLSQASYKSRPFVIIDYKRDALLNEIPNVEEIGYKSKLRKNGLHIIHPRPDENEQMEEFLWRLWERENTGVYIDEGYMVPDKGALRAILTQGRSKKIPVIMLSQRPVWLSRFVFSEADFFMVLDVSDKDDQKIIQRIVPDDFKRELPPYHSRYYDVGRKRVTYLLPVPGRDTILDSFGRADEARRLVFV